MPQMVKYCFLCIVFFFVVVVFNPMYLAFLTVLNEKVNEGLIKTSIPVDQLNEFTLYMQSL